MSESDDFLLQFWDLSGAKVCQSCRSRRELSNEYLVAKLGVDTEENYRLSKFCLGDSIQYTITSLPRGRSSLAWRPRSCDASPPRSPWSQPDSTAPAFKYEKFFNLLQQLAFFVVAATAYNYLISAAFSGIFTDFWKFSNDFDSFCRKSSKFR